MGLLTTAQYLMIRSGDYTVHQQYAFLIPEAAPATTFETKNIHNGQDLIRVLDNGSMVREGFNQAMISPGKMDPGLYSFECSNRDDLLGRFSTFWIHGSTAYHANPTECRLQRFVTIEKDGSLELLLPTLYIGTVKDVKYKWDGLNPLSVVFSVMPVSQSLLADNVWDESDYDELDLNQIFGGPVPGEN